MKIKTNGNIHSPQNTQFTTERIDAISPSTTTQIFMHKGAPTWVNTCPNLGGTMDQTVLLPELGKMCSLVHENILAFYGVVLDFPNSCVLSDVAPRGSLYDLLGGTEMVLTQDIKLSLLSDIAAGMRYLHLSPLGMHGRLTSRCCVIDHRWLCKISEYWTCSLTDKYSYDIFTDAIQLLWAAPEMLRGKPPSNKCDVYSYGIIVQEVITESKPFGTNNPTLAPREIVKRVGSPSNKPYRPSFPVSLYSNHWIELAQICWHEEPHRRPSFGRVRSVLTSINGGQQVNFVDSMATRLEAHTKRLEEIVEERSRELFDEKAKAETLLCELLPRSVYEQLKNGNMVEPETYNNITICFSDIVGFTKVSSLATPLEIVSLLNKLYFIFDEVADGHDVYKVATIGDAYMAVSGLPVRNGDNHAKEVAAMSLELLDSIGDFEIDHMPGEYLNMRVGIHSGPCVAAVTGRKMPRYLLFGDTVNTTSYMEALSTSMRIHLSESTTKLLKRHRRFIVEKRGKVHIPGYGPMTTSWLVGTRD